MTPDRWAVLHDRAEAQHFPDEESARMQFAICASQPWTGCSLLRKVGNGEWTIEATLGAA